MDSTIKITKLFYFIICGLAASMPLLSFTEPQPVTGPEFPGWPTHFAGKTLHRLPDSPVEQRFAQGFPGRLAQFTDGERNVLIRWVTEPSRKLHPSADCFQGTGYRITPRPLWIDAQQQLWRSFQAEQGQKTLRVYERIYDEQGGSWTDVSTWYWNALLGNTQGPWWAITFIEA